MLDAFNVCIQVYIWAGITVSHVDGWQAEAYLNTVAIIHSTRISSWECPADPLLIIQLACTSSGFSAKTFATSCHWCDFNPCSCDCLLKELSTVQQIRTCTVVSRNASRGMYWGSRRAQIHPSHVGTRAPSQVKTSRELGIVHSGTTWSKASRE